MVEDVHRLLLALCDTVYKAQKRAEEEHKQELFGDSVPIELSLMRRDKVRIEIRKENVSHNEPHLHITHSDKIDVSVSLNDFQVLAGNIDNKTLKYLLRDLRPVQDKLKRIWATLNEQDNSIGAEKLISNLFG